MNIEELVQSLRTIRTNKGLSVKEVAEAIRITPATIWNIESNKSMSFSSLEAYANYLGHPVTYELEGYEEPEN